MAVQMVSARGCRVADWEMKKEGFFRTLGGSGKDGGRDAQAPISA